MGLDRTGAGPDDGAEPVEQPPPVDRRPPPDGIGDEGHPSRADSRSGAAAANETGAQATGKHREDNVTGGQGSDETGPGETSTEGQASTEQRSDDAIPEQTVDQPSSGDESIDLARAPDLRTRVWNVYLGDYNTPNTSEERAIGERQHPFEQPSHWVGDINPGYGDPTRADRDRNCADCTRSVERNWRGESQVAAGLVPSTGEWNQRTEDWSGSRFEKMNFSDIESRLAAGGHGSSAMIGVDWRGGGGHYFNAVNSEGEILAVDGQTGLVEGWPPSVNGLGYDASDVTVCEAIVRDRHGREF
jgi:hypothetical protein